MSIGLATRVELARAFLHLTGSTRDDDALSELDAAAGDQLYYYLTQGAWAAQQYMLEHGWPDMWQKTSTALVYAADGTERYAVLPTDFLALAGDFRRSSLYDAQGREYGMLVDGPTLSGRWGSNSYALRNDRLYLGEGFGSPALTLRYHYRHPEFDADAVAVDFPKEHRPLIVAEAGVLASADSWLPGGQDMEARIDRAVNAARGRAAGARRSRQPRTYGGPPAFNSNWI